MPRSRAGRPRPDAGASDRVSRQRSVRSMRDEPSRTGRAPGRRHRAPTGARSHLSPALERLRQRDLIGVLEVAADRQAAREPSNAHAERLDQGRHVHRGCVPLEVGIRREDALGHVVALDTLEQLLHAKVLGADAVERADRTAEDVIPALVERALLDRCGVLRLLNDAQAGAVAALVPTDAAEVALSDVAALA